MAAGFDFAEGEIIIPMDSDLQNDPKDIPILLEEISVFKKISTHTHATHFEAA